MKMTNKFLFKTNVRYCCLWILMAFVATVQMNAQDCVMTVRQNTNLSLDNTACKAQVAPDMVGTYAYCSDLADLEVRLVDAWGDTVRSEFTGEAIDSVWVKHIGQTLTVIVTDIDSGNSSWGYIKVEDKIDPVITCPVAMDLHCHEVDTYRPVATDNCNSVDDGSLKVRVVNEVVTPCSTIDDTYLRYITRSYIAEDKYGNTSDTCQVTIRVLKSDLASDLGRPANLMLLTNNALMCDAGYPKDDKGNPRPDTTYNADGTVDKAGTGVPTLDGVALSLSLTDSLNQACNLMVSYTDEVREIKCVQKIFRRWQVYEWSCAGEQQDTTFMQIIEIADTAAPKFDTVPDMTVSTLAHECAGLAQLPPVQATDNCNEDFKYNIGWATGSIQTNGGAVKLPLGVNEVVYRVEDGCGNYDTDTMYVTVIDKTPPQPICKQFITVSLSKDGLAKVPATAFDNGSWDECNFDKVLVRRMDTTCDGFEFENGQREGKVDTFFEYIHFCCSDVSATGDRVMVVMRAYDHAGNYNDCMVQVDVQNKIPPIITCPENITVDCDFAYNKEDLAASFGTASVFVGSCEDVVKELEPVYDFTICNTGTITRTFEATNAGGTDRCQQVITFEPKDPFNDGVLDIEEDTDIFWPADTTLTMCGDPESDDFHPRNLPEGYGFPKYREGSCDLVGSNWKDDVFTFNNTQGDACFKIVRHWTVIDWCQFNKVSSVRFYVDVRKIRTSLEGRGIDLSGIDLDHISTASDLADLLSMLTTSLSGATLPAGVTLEEVLNDVLAGLYLDGEASYYPKWTWTQVIKISDTEAPVLVESCDRVSTCTYDTACEGGYISLTQSATDNCSREGLRWWYRIDANNDGTFETQLGNRGEGYSADASGVYPVGSHRIQWIFEDKCGNQTSCDQLFDIINCKTPTPYCINGLSMSLMPVDANNDGTAEDGMVEVWASDFDRGSAHPCGYKVYLSFEEVTELDADKKPVVVASKAFTCADLGRQTINLYAVVVTPMDSILQDFCTTFVDIQDNQNICPSNTTPGTETSNRTVAGTITTPKATTMGNVSVALLGSDTANATTNGSGAYAFTNVADGGSFVVKPTRNDDYLNGVNTLDIALIERHLLEIKEITDPYVLLAADVNNDGKIKPSDLLALRKLILGLTEELPNVNSWRFVDKAYKFADAANPFSGSVPSTYEINSIDSDMTIDFVGFKVGDVNADASINGEEATGRSANVFGLATENVRFDAGETVTLPITATNAEAILGTQFTINLNGLELVDVQSDVLDITTDNVAQVAEGTVTFSWNAANAIAISKGDVIATITVNATEAGQLTEALAINSDVTTAQAYDANLETMDVDFEITTRSVEGLDFAVYQNKPNPFSDMTNITFDLPEASVVSFKVFDLTGKVVTASSRAYEAGSHVITVSTNTIQNSGIYYYQIEAGKYTATKKMVVIE